MLRVMRHIVTAGAVAGSCILAAPTTAYAVGGGAVVGTGYFDPGLPCPYSCHIHIDFTIAGGGTEGVGTATCTFDGDTGADTILQGSGSGYIDCSGGVNQQAWVDFTRTGTVMQINGSAGVRASGTMVCGWNLLWTSGAPTTSFATTGFCLWL
jgi:hypothetical protein